MATITHSTPSFDITAADDMDLHSDHDALEYNDGDIELDLEPPASYAPDDDVSIDDAVSTSGMEAQAAPSGDNDDYMVDQEDVIEEDYSYQDVDIDTVVEPSAAADTIPTEAQADVQDEDLLDYSEEDDDYHDTTLRSPWLQEHNHMQNEPDHTQHVPDQQGEPLQAQDASTEHEEASQIQNAPVQQDEIPADLQALMSITTSKTSQSPKAHADVVTDDSLNAENHENLPRPQSAGSTEDDAQANDNGGVLLKSQEEHESAESGQSDMANPGHDHDESAQNSKRQEDNSFQLPPVTVNCMGEELWLFKQHDYENNGDWLLEDVSVARTSMSDLFQACRAALGHEVLSGMEIGFRFDHFNNMELFEESTASVAISLERLVGYYHMLYAQDGNNEPDSFYITLMYRPRFATLLADIARYADSGRGFSGLEAAIAAGETNFHSASLGLPAEETTEWETEGQEQEPQQADDEEHESEPEQEEDASEQTHEEDANDAKHAEDANEEKNAENQAQQDAEAQIHASDQFESEERDEQTYEEAQIQEKREPDFDHDEDENTQESHEEGGVDIHENEEVTAEDASNQERQAHNDEDQTQQSFNSHEVSANAHDAAGHDEQIQLQSEDQTAAEVEARRLQAEGDIIDYSDGEDEESATVGEVEQAPHVELSPSPATVQGDESTNVETQLSAKGSPSTGEQMNGDDGGASFNTGEDPDTGVYQGFDGEANEAEYWAYVEACEEESLSNESQSEEVGEDGAGWERQDDASPDYGGYEYQDLEQQAKGEVEFANGEEFHGEVVTTDGDDFSGANDIPGLDDADLGRDVAEKTATTHEDDDADAQDEEDGVAGQIASATSSAADPTTASSTDAHGVSPQGRKRSSDEAGHGVDIAPDSIDAKRARV